MKARILALVAALAANVAHANDSSATLAAGGLTLKKSAEIEMVSEDLFVSTKEIRVSYVFRNASAKDITTQVAFPLPRIEAMWRERDVPLAAPEAANFVNFTTKVEGKPMPLTPVLRATLKGKDVTARLQSLGVPLNPLSQGINAAMAKLKPADRAALIKEGLFEESKYDAGQGWQADYIPFWDLDTAFVREQTFPAGRAVRVEHRYEPVAGGSVGSIHTIKDLANSAEALAERKKFCMDPAFRAAAMKKQAQAGEDMYVAEQRVSYILKTGANWKGPIKDFRLVVDKGAAGNLVSFCGANVKKISPTQFEMRAKNFTPSADLDVLILVPR